jgi:predicted RNA-binding protein with PIN domain
MYLFSERAAMFFDAAKIMVCCSSFVLEGKGHTLILATSAKLEQQTIILAASKNMAARSLNKYIERPKQKQ